MQKTEALLNSYEVERRSSIDLFEDDYVSFVTAVSGCIIIISFYLRAVTFLDGSSSHGPFGPVGHQPFLFSASTKTLSACQVNHLLPHLQYCNHKLSWDCTWIEMYNMRGEIHRRRHLCNYFTAQSAYRTTDCVFQRYGVLCVENLNWIPFRSLIISPWHEIRQKRSTNHSFQFWKREW